MNGEPEEEILFISHIEVGEPAVLPPMARLAVLPPTGQKETEFKIAGRTCKPCGRVPPGVPPGLSRGFRVLMEDEDDDDDEDEEVPEVLHIRTVEDKKKTVKGKKWASLGVGDIVVDSAADESCWPVGQGDAFPTQPSKRRLLLKTANGGEMKHYGEKDITIQTPDGEVLGLKFQVTDVHKPLLAVRRLVEKGNVVSFGPEPNENFILNKSTGKKIMMEKKGGSFVVKANFVADLAADAEAVFSRPVG